MAIKMLAGENAQKIRTLLEAHEGHADLYRTAEAGPSGQRKGVLVGRIRYRDYGPDEFEIIDMSDGRRAGFARHTIHGEWSITADRDSDGLTWIGYASSLSVGVDVLINGEHGALGRHDSRRISSGYIRKGPERPPARGSAS